MTVKLCLMPHPCIDPAKTVRYHCLQYQVPQ